MGSFSGALSFNDDNVDGQFRCPMGPVKPGGEMAVKLFDTLIAEDRIALSCRAQYKAMFHL